MEEINVDDISYTDDSVKLYLQEIGRYKLLSTDEEKDLILKINEGDERAKQKLVEANLRLVVSVAKKYMNKGIAFLDLVQAGNEGLLKAVSKVDATKDNTFSTYATWWIKQCISREINKSKNALRYPEHVYTEYNKFLRILYDNNLIESGKIDKKRVSELTDYKIEDIEFYERMFYYIKTTSLNEEIGDDNYTLEDTIVDNNSISPEEYCISSIATDDLMIYIDKLNSKEAYILKARFGLLEEGIISKKEISKKFKMRQSDIAYYEKKAISKLRRILQIEKVYFGYDVYEKGRK